MGLLKSPGTPGAFSVSLSVFGGASAIRDLTHDIAVWPISGKCGAGGARNVLTPATAFP
jgi:hypothetical protein